MLFNVSDHWRLLYPTSAVGILAMRTQDNPTGHPALEARRLAAEVEISQRYAGGDRSTLLALPVLQAYTAYYKRFKKTYHVLLQVESIAYKGRSIPIAPGLIQSMFIAELENLLLTAGHDLDVVVPPLRLGAAQGGESYQTLMGHEQSLKEGDMYIADRDGIISSILGGPDRRTSISPDTRRVLYTVYAPPGVEHAIVLQHLASIRNLVRLFDPAAQQEAMSLVK